MTSPDHHLARPVRPLRNTGPAGAGSVFLRVNHNLPEPMAEPYAFTMQFSRLALTRCPPARCHDGRHC